MKKVLIFILIIIIVLGGSYYVYKNYIEEKDYIATYKEETNIKIKELNIVEKLKTKKYSKTLENIILNNLYQDKYLENYLVIDYQKEKLIFINSLLDKKYSNNEINYIFQKLSVENIKKLLKKDYIDIVAYFDIQNFNFNNLDRYVDYASSNNYSLDKIVTYVNLNLDYDFYTHTSDIKEPSSVTVLVNKYNKLPSDYEPILVKTKNNKYVRDIVKEDLENMINDINSEGYNLSITSAYRSYDTQNTIYNNYVKRDGKTYTDKVSARPGYSEHQTGLAIDFWTNGYSLSTFDQTKEYIWLTKNAYKYGFIMRYPEGKEFITGYNYESWHYRYVGKEIATYIYENDITFDEYYDLFLN